MMLILACFAMVLPQSQGELKMRCTCGAHALRDQFDLVFKLPGQPRVDEVVDSISWRLYRGNVAHLWVGAHNF